MTKVKNTDSIVSKTKLEAVLRDNKGKFFSCVFVKKSGELRKLHGRLGVRKGTNGKGKSIANSSNSYVTVWDRKAESFRNINLDTISVLNLAGKKLKVV